MSERKKNIFSDKKIVSRAIQAVPYTHLDVYKRQGKTEKGQQTLHRRHGDGRTYGQVHGVLFQDNNPCHVKACQDLALCFGPGGVK